MRQDCLDSVGEMLGRQLAPQQGENIEARVKDQMKVLAGEDPDAWRQKSYYTKLTEAAAAAAQQMKDELAQKRANVERQIAVHDRIENFLAAQPNSKAGDGLKAVSRILDFDTRSGGYTSVQSWSNAIRNEAYANLIKTWKAIPGNFFGLFESEQGVKDLWKEIHGEDSGNAVAKEGAKAWHETAEGLRQRFNDGGGGVGKREDWSKPQHHSQARVAAAGIDQWMGDTQPRLDRNQYVNYDGSRMSDDQVHNFLTHAYDSIITDGHNSMEPGSVSGSGVIANRNAAHRQIFFKDSDAAAEYNALYGEKSLNNLLAGHVSRMARDIALVERLGPNSEQTFRYFNDRALQDELRQDPTKINYLQKQSKFNEALFDAVAGKEQVVDQRVADFGQGFRNWMTATKLGKVVITALGDEAGMFSTAIANHVPYAQTLINEVRRIAATEARSQAEHAGLGLDVMLGHLNRFAQEDYGSSFSGKMASTVMRASGAERMWAARRQGMGAVIMSSIGNLTRTIEHVEDLHPEDHGVLAGKGITDTDWQVWRRATPEDWGSGTHSVLTPKSIWSIPDEKLADLGNPLALKRQATTQLLAHTLEEAGMGAMDTGPRQRIAVNLGTQRGSIGGELLRSMMLFRGFSVSMMMKHWNRAAAMPTVGGKAAYLAPLFMYGTLIAAAGNQVRNLLAGQDPENMRPDENPGFWGKAILRGGGLGFFGDFLYNETSEHETTLAAALGGPAATTAEDLLNLTHGAFFQSKRGQITDERAKIIRFAKGNIPLINMWYTQAAADHLLWNNIQEAASPGYLARMQAKQEATYGKTYYWKPEDTLPHQAPDLAKATGGSSRVNFGSNQ